MKCHSDPDPGNLLVSTLRPDREDLIRRWARPRLSRVVSCAQFYRRRALSFASQRRRGQLWNVRRHAARRICDNAIFGPRQDQSVGKCIRMYLPISSYAAGIYLCCMCAAGVLLAGVLLVSFTFGKSALARAAPAPRTTGGSRCPSRRRMRFRCSDHKVTRAQ